MHYSSRLFIFSVVILSGWFGSLPAHAEDRIVGIIWEFGVKAKDPNRKVKWGGQRFRATPDWKVWNMPTQSVPRVIGSWSGTDENVKMKLTGIMHPKNRKANGDYEFVLVGKAPKVWRGTFTQAGTGRKKPIFVRLVKD